MEPLAPAKTLACLTSKLRTDALRALDLSRLLQSEDYQLIGQEVGPYSRHEELVWQDELGPLTISRARSGDSNFYCLRLGDEIAVDVLPGRLFSVQPAAEIGSLTVEHFLADQVLPRVLAQKGELVLHAGAIRNESFAILLIGSSGSGKSTLTASFYQSGWTLIGDDSLILSSQTGVPAVRSIYPSLRLFPDSIAFLLPDDVPNQAMADYSSKRRIGISIAERASPEPFPVRAAFVLDDECGDRIAVRRLSIADACMAFVKNSFSLDPSDLERARQRLEQASKLAKHIPAFSITYPRDYQRLGEVREAVMSTLADDSTPRH